MTSEYIKQLQALNAAYNAFNMRYFGGTLPDVTITIQRSLRSYGHFSIDKVWQTSDGVAQHEINISADYLRREKYNLCATLLHEMCHLYAKQNNIEDTSRQGRYHNKYFRKIAEERDLQIDLAEGIGWSVTSPTEKLKAFVDNSKIEFVNLYRVAVEQERAPNKRTKVYKYVCPRCGLEVKTTKENAKLHCIECDVDFNVIV